MRNKTHIIFILIALMMMAGKTQAQEYLPMVQEGNEWHTLFQGMALDKYNYVFSCSGDTLVDNVQYSKLILTRDEHEPYLFSLLREVDGKVWALYFLNNPEEFLLYDFTANVGDNLVVGDFGTNYVVDSISTEHIGGLDRKKLWLVTNDYLGNPQVRETWIEGIGSNLGMPWSGWGVGVYDFYSRLLCFHQDGELVWQNPQFDGCTYTAVEEIQGNETVSFYPNPTNGIVNVEGHDIIEVKVYNALGQLVKETKDDVLDLSDQEAGIYILKVITPSETITKQIIKK
jgi:hypothetical protein